LPAEDETDLIDTVVIPLSHSMVDHVIAQLLAVAAEVREAIHQARHK
jgi:hypothetical protein